MELEHVNGIIVWEDGIPHSFGVNKMASPKELTDENYHSTSFLIDIYPKKWFQDTEYPYDQKLGFGRQLGDLASFGFVTLCNTSSRITDQDDYYCFLINAPINISDNAKDYLTSIYEDFKELLERKQAYFQGTAYLENGDYAWKSPAFTLEEFYDKLEIPKAKKHTK